MNKSKLVYTTDKNNPAYVDNIGGMSAMDSVFAREANIERRQSINQMNKSRRRHFVMEKPKAKIGKPISEAKKKEVTWVINSLWRKKASRSEILTLLPNRGKKYIDNLMQTIKFAVEPYIFSKDGLWQISEDCPMDAANLIELAINNRGARFRKSKQNKVPKEKLTKRTISQIVDNDLHEEFYGDHLKSKKIVVDSGAPVEIEIKTGKASIVIKIG